VYIVPFVIGWLICLLRFKQLKSLKWLFFAGLLLGIGIHSYHAAKVMMPIYLIMSVFFVWPEIKKNKLLIAILFSGFILPILPLIPWLQKYPDTLTDQVKYTHLYNLSNGPFAGILALFTAQSLISRILVFLAFFS